MFACQTWQVFIYLSPTYTILPDNSATKQEINQKQATKTNEYQTKEDIEHCGSDTN